MSAIKDIKGKVFGDLTVIRKSHQNKENRWFWVCKCSCGNIKIYSKNILDYERTHCGCKANKTPRLSHGMTKTKIYKTWTGLKNRCLNEKNKDYKNYGARGITVSKQWKESFESFLKDMGMPPHARNQIDRINTTKGYSKKNCRWTSRKQNMSNRLDSRLWHIKGFHFESAIDAANWFGVAEITIHRWCKGGGRTIKKDDCNCPKRYPHDCNN